MRTGSRQSGHALLLALIVVVLVGVAGAVLTTTLGLHLHAARDETQRIQLVAMSDAAVAESLAELAGSPGFGGVSKRDFGPGQIESTVQTISASRRRIIAIATLTSGRRLRVAADVRILNTGLVVTSWQRLPAE
ncbi:MAG: hypothetical protein WBH85_18835 [Thermoanaerobaculia bacterium]